MKRKQQVEIGKRAHKAILSLFPDKSNVFIAKVIGTNTTTLWEWGQGKTPSGIFLARMLELGVDVEWILTGRSNGNENYFRP